MLDKVMKFTKLHMLLIAIIVLALGGAGYAVFLYPAGFTGYSTEEPPVRNGEADTEGFRSTRQCNKCGKSRSRCGCPGLLTLNRPAPIAPCPRVIEPDLSKYILKSQVPALNRSQMPDMSNYMLKTECPPVPDLSKYILKASIPKPQPVIIDNSKCKTDSGECPPCPRPRCPVVKCPEPTKCPPPAPCPRAVCPPTVVKCKSEESYHPTVRPFLAPLNSGTFGSA